MQNTLQQKISKVLNLNNEQVTNFYSGETDGIFLFKNIISTYIDEDTLKQWYERKGKGFVRKDEKYIENNQEVSVVFNDEVCRIYESKDNEEKILHEMYLAIRSQIEKYSNVPFVQGDRLETKLIKYPVSSLGVGSHKDLSSNVNCIVLMNLYGSTYFYTATDKVRSNEKRYLVEPGDIMVMRGPRNQSENGLRMEHYVLEIPEERLVFVCREIEDKVEKIVNKNNWRGF